MIVDLTVLSRVPHFADLPTTLAARIAAASRLIEGEAGATVIDMRSAPSRNEFTFLVAGAWTMQRYVAGIEQPAIWIDRRPGSWHGGVALIDAIAPAIVTLYERSTLLAVPADVLIETAAAHPALAAKMLQGMSGGAELLSQHAQKHLAI